MQLEVQPREELLEDRGLLPRRIDDLLQLVTVHLPHEVPDVDVAARGGLARIVVGASFFIRDSRDSFLTRSAVSLAITGRASALTDFPNLLTYSLIHFLAYLPTYRPTYPDTHLPTHLRLADLLTYRFTDLLL